MNAKTNAKMIELRVTSTMTAHNIMRYRLWNPANRRYARSSDSLNPRMPMAYSGPPTYWAWECQYSVRGSLLKALEPYLREPKNVLFRYIVHIKTQTPSCFCSQDTVHQCLIMLPSTLTTRELTPHSISAICRPNNETQCCRRIIPAAGPDDEPSAVYSQQAG